MYQGVTDLSEMAPISAFGIRLMELFGLSLATTLSRQHSNPPAGPLSRSPVVSHPDDPSRVIVYPGATPTAAPGLQISSGLQVSRVPQLPAPLTRMWPRERSRDMIALPA